MWSWPIRRKRLIERRTRLVKLIARYQAIIDEIEAELRMHGIEPRAYRPAWPYPLPGIKRGEMRHLCVAILRDAPVPMKMRDIVVAIMAQKGMDGSDARLVRLVTGRAGSAFEATDRRGLTQLVGLRNSKNVRRKLVQPD